MANGKDRSEGLAEILRGIEQLGAKARGLNLHTLSFLLDMAKLEAIRLSHREEGSGR
jgi:hypothetical protein